jgi:hypothetical protein
MGRPGGGMGSENPLGKPIGRDARPRGHERRRTVFMNPGHGNSVVLNDSRLTPFEVAWVNLPLCTTADRLEVHFGLVIYDAFHGVMFAPLSVTGNLPESAGRRKRNAKTQGQNNADNLSMSHMNHSIFGGVPFVSPPNHFRAAENKNGR